MSDREAADELASHSSGVGVPAALQVKRAIDDGFDVRGFMYWTLIGAPFLAR